MAKSASLEAFGQLMAEIGDNVPDGGQYQRLSRLILDFPESRELASLDPATAAYKAAALRLYLLIRGRAAEGYVAARDERPATALPANLWTGLPPWSFRDAGMFSEHLFAWAQVFHHAHLPPGGALLEYGPGSGQMLLMAARLGYRACGVDIDEQALASIRAQAEHLGVPVELECAGFGGGFGEERFDTILFYEAFHHAFDFDDLLARLQARIKPGGRVVLCGEPIVRKETPGIPYPWGPRLDALSVFCMRRFGWMELGFTRDYFLRAARAKGWAVSFHPCAGAGRAEVYVLESASGPKPPGTDGGARSWLRLLRNPRALRQKLRAYLLRKLQG